MSSSSSSSGPPKIFIGGIDSEVTEEELAKQYTNMLEPRGHSIVKIEWPFDRARQQRKNYAFIQLDSDAAIRVILEAGDRQKIGRRYCDVRRAVPNHQPAGMGMRGGGGGASQNRFESSQNRFHQPMQNDRYANMQQQQQQGGYDGSFDAFASQASRLYAAIVFESGERWTFFYPVGNRKQ